MCGLAGFIDPAGAIADPGLLLGSMGDVIAHRGPDMSGIWWDEAARIGLSHRRLSILDLSAAGAQPMVSHSGRLVIAFNGEIYNFPELRSRLVAEVGHIGWRGTSDTEMLLEAIERWGIRRTLELCNGMFALACWDRNTRELTLARDRFGEKPLYYGWHAGALFFASELKSIRCHQPSRLEIDPAATSLLLQAGYVPWPRSIYKGIRKLPPGTYLTMGAAPAAGYLAEPVRYWSALDAARSALRRRSRTSLDEAAREAEPVLARAVKLRMHADVPLGAFLSGGIDSSLVVALMQAQTDRPVNTFSIGFPSEKYDETPYASAVANMLGTRHTSGMLEPREALDIIPALPRMYDEPMADSSQIPTFLVSKFARREVIVALSGDGGDELFGGYSRYLATPRLFRKQQRVPAPLRRLMAAMLDMPGAGFWRHADSLLAAMGRRPGGRSGLQLLAARWSRFAAAMDLKQFVAQRSSLLPKPPVHDDSTDFTSVMDGDRWPGSGAGDGDALMLLDTATYLTDDILHKVDRASMATSLEVRVPLLDPDVFGLAWSLPQDVKIRDGRTKLVLRRVLEKHVPAAMFERPKRGFSLPVGEWLRGPLRPWAEELLSEKRLLDSGLLRPEPIRRLWQWHLDSVGDGWQNELWPVLSFQDWLTSNR